MKTITYILLIGLLVASCSNNGDKSDAYGNFEVKETIIASEANGKLVYLDLEEGTKLNKGKLVAIIDTTQLYLNKELAKAKKEAIATKLTSINAQIEVQEEQQKKLEREVKRVENLIKGNAATTKQLDDLTAQLDVVKKTIASIQTQKKSVFAEMNTTQKQVEILEDQLNKCYIKNPVQGVVLEKYVESHELVNMGRSLYKIAGLDIMELKVYVSGTQLPQIKIGQKVKVYIDKTETENTELEGTISWISEKAEFTPKVIQTKEERVSLVYAVKILVKNDGRLKIGMPGEIKF